MNRLISSIAENCARYRLQDKTVIAPTLRAGNQWVEQVALSGDPVFNLRVQTLRGLALEFAGPSMAAGGLELLTRLKTDILLAGLWSQIMVEGGYLGQIEPELVFFRTLSKTITAVRSAGLGPEELQNASFESDIKKSELIALLRAYEKKMQEKRMVDYAGALEIAVRAAREKELRDLPLILMPESEDLEQNAMESRFIESIPRERLIKLPVDMPPASESRGKPRCDTDLLKYVLSPSDAPEPAGDGSVRFFRAAGEANEVREVFRLCIKDNLPLDSVEILYTDARTYVPLIYELAGTFFPSHDPRSGNGLVTFADGVPVAYTSPGRALSAWLEWRRMDCARNILERMIHDGLFKAPGNDAHFAHSELADALRSVPMCRGPADYLPKIDEKIRSLNSRISSSGRSENGDTGFRHMLEDEIKRLHVLRVMLGKFVDITSCDKTGTDIEFLSAAKTFLAELVRTAGELDVYAMDILIGAIDQAGGMLEDGLFSEGAIDLAAWMAGLPAELSVGGMGARPSAIHVSNLRSGGHTGRAHTFILGLDETRLPAASFQDPMLLDSERKKVSSHLPTSDALSALEERKIAGTLAALRGRVTLSYTSCDIREGDEKAPCPYILAAFRAVSGMHQADMEEFPAAVGLENEVSFAPAVADECFNLSDLLLSRFCSGAPSFDRRVQAAAFYPHAKRGLKAERLRNSKDFTAFDGHIAAAGKDHNPIDGRGSVLSASRLEKLAKCPLSYFFEKILGLELPDEFKYDPDIWLDPLRKGSIMHGVFRDFMTGQIESGEPPDPQRDHDVIRINKILDEALAVEKKLNPPPRRDMEQSVRSELAGSCRIFLAAQREFYRLGNPQYLEAAVGLKNRGHGSALDSAEPVGLKLPGGGCVQLCGRLDRIDVLGEPENSGFAVWDYKTGGSRRFRGKDRVYDGGRIVQHAVYLHLARRRLGEHAGVPADVRFFGYFFPSVSAEGEFIKYTPQQLADSTKVIEHLCKILSCGAFPAAEDGGACRHCDFSKICDDTPGRADNSRLKLENEDNKALGPMRDVREWK